MRIGNFTVDRHWAWNPGVGAVSLRRDEPDTEPEAAGYGWGLNPWDERPDGESKALDYLAATLLKSSTTINGVLVVYYNSSRCTDWLGPDSEGSYRCASIGPKEDGFESPIDSSWWAEPGGALYAAPMATIASSGWPDPEVPGRIVTHLAGSPALARPEFEGCSYPHTFVPDLASYEDEPGGAVGSVTGNVYRFGKDDSDIRVVMNTNRRRGYCPNDGQP